MLPSSHDPLPQEVDPREARNLAENPMTSRNRNTKRPRRPPMMTANQRPSLFPAPNEVEREPAHCPSILSILWMRNVVVIPTLPYRHHLMMTLPGIVHHYHPEKLDPWSILASSCQSHRRHRCHHHRRQTWPTVPGLRKSKAKASKTKARQHSCSLTLPMTAKLMPNNCLPLNPSGQAFCRKPRGTKRCQEEWTLTFHYRHKTRKLQIRHNDKSISLRNMPRQARPTERQDYSGSSSHR